MVWGIVMKGSQGTLTSEKRKFKKSEIFIFWKIKRQPTQIWIFFFKLKENGIFKNRKNMKNFKHRDITYNKQFHILTILPI